MSKLGEIPVRRTMKEKEENCLCMRYNEHQKKFHHHCDDIEEKRQKIAMSVVTDKIDFFLVYFDNKKNAAF
jgi:hypothetical protein